MPYTPPCRQRSVRTLNVLRYYLAAPFRRGEALPLPTFRVIARTYRPGDAPRTGVALGRKSVGSHSDPTAAQAVAELEGITVYVPETIRYPAALVADLLAALSAHLGEPLRAVLVDHQTPAATATRQPCGCGIASTETAKAAWLRLARVPVQSRTTPR